jgi:OmpA-OmpF porin, OOP family
MKIKKVVLAALLAAVPALATAQDRGWYVGASVGQSNVEVCGGILAGTTCNDESVAYRGFVGYEVNRNLAFEGGYGYLGEVKATGPGGSVKITGDGLEASALGILPINGKFSLFGRAGVHYSTLKATGAGGQSADETESDLTFGFGAAYDFTRQFRMRAEFQRYYDVAGVDVQVVGISLVYRFR